MKRTWIVMLFFLFTLPLTAQSQEREWTFLVYLSGNNDLDDFGYADMNEMEKVGSTDQINVVVQWASLKAKTVKRVYVQRDSDDQNVTSPVIEDLGNVDMGDYRSLSEFIKWGVKNYPAKKYFIDVWNHGSGWRATTARDITKEISFDENTGHWISTKQLGLSLSESSKFLGRKFDLYGSDACLMSMIEIATEMQNSVGHFLGSQELEPGDGWPYDLLLQRWSQNPSIGAQDVAQILVKSYFESYSTTSNKDRITLSSIDMKQLGRVNALLKVVAASLQAATAADKTKILDAVKSTQKFFYSDYRDLVHLLSLLEKADLVSVKAADLQDLKIALAGLITSNQAGAKYPGAFGLSIWFPDSKQFPKYETRYRDLNFGRTTGWTDALKSVLGL